MNKWYVIKVVNGKERKMKEAIEFELEQNGTKGVISNLLIPTQKSVQIKRGKKVTVDKNLFPGYIFVECESIKDVESNIKHIGGITSILEQRLSKIEVDRILGTEEESEKEVNTNLQVEQRIKIIDGPFDTFVGTIKELYNKNQKVKVNVSIFGRDTEIDLDVSQVVDFY